MQPDGEAAQHTFGQKLIPVTQHQILGLAPAIKLDRLSGRQQLRRQPNGRCAVSQGIAQLETLHQRQQLGTHVNVNGVSPQALTIGVVEAAEVRLHGFVVQDSEHGFGRPLILQNHDARKQWVVLKVQENAQIVQVPA